MWKRVFTEQNLEIPIKQRKIITGTSWCCNCQKFFCFCMFSQKLHRIEGNHNYDDAALERKLYCEESIEPTP
jgi:hypothetical protein